MQTGSMASPALLETRRRGGWTAVFPPQYAWLADQLTAVDSIPARCSTVLRDNRHAFVGVLEIDGLTLIAKRPRYKDDRPWIRFWSLFRESHAFRSLRAMARLAHEGVRVPEPVLALTERCSGTVKQSWIFYRYVDGRPCDASHYGEIVAALEDLHSRGWHHGDPHFANFLATESGVVMIDLFSVRRRRGRVCDWYDRILLRNSHPPIADAIRWARRDPAFIVADGYDRWIHFWRRMKRGMRAGLGAQR